MVVEVNLRGLLGLSKSDLSGDEYQDQLGPVACCCIPFLKVDLVKTYRIPLDLHPRLPNPGFTMDHLPDGAIGIYSKFLWFFGVRDWFSFSKRRNTKDVCMDDDLLSLKKWKDKFFMIDRRAIPDYLTRRHSCSCVSNDLPTDGYTQNDVELLCARLIFLHEMMEEVLVQMSIYDFMALLSWGGAKVAEESHHLSSPLLERVPSHTTTPAAEGAMILLPTPDEIVASFPDPCLAKKSKGPSQVRLVSSAPEPGQAKDVDEADLTKLCVEIENSLERDEGISTRATLAPTPRLGKRLGDPPYVAIVSASGPSRVRTSAHASTSGCSFSLGGVAVSGHTRKSRAEFMQRQMDPMDFLARSALARDVECLIHMKVLLPPYTKEDWNGRHSLEDNILYMGIFKDPDICRKALDWTITPAELKITESLLPLDYRIFSMNRLQEKFDRKAGYVKFLRSELTTLDGKLKRMQKDCDALGQENRELRLSEELSHTKAKLYDQALVVRDFHNQLALEKAKSQGYKDVVDGLREEVARFVGYDVESLVQKFLSSDEFHATLAHIASLGINYGVEKGLRMGRTDAEFEVIAQKVSNFHISAKADNRELRSQKNAASDKVKELKTELTDAKLALEKAKSRGYKDVVDGFWEEVSRFVSFDVESLVQKLLSSDKFHAALVHITSLGINYGVDRGLRIGRTDAEFEVKELLTELTDARVANIDGLREEVARFIGFDVESLVQKLLSSDEFYAVLAHIASLSINFGVERGLRMGPLVDFPTTLFYFLGKVVAASVGTLFEVTQILPDKYSRSVTSAPVAPSITNEDVDQVPFEHASDDLASSI
ncbi:hypothetical protein Tco_0738250 [Tanacetum coccineum]